MARLLCPAWWLWPWDHWTYKKCMYLTERLRVKSDYMHECCMQKKRENDKIPKIDIMCATWSSSEMCRCLGKPADSQCGVCDMWHVTYKTVLINWMTIDVAGQKTGLQISTWMCMGFCYLRCCGLSSITILQASCQWLQPNTNSAKRCIYSFDTCGTRRGRIHFNRIGVSNGQTLR